MDIHSLDIKGPSKLGHTYIYIYIYMCVCRLCMLSMCMVCMCVNVYVMRVFVYVSRPVLLTFIAIPAEPIYLGTNRGLE